MKILSFVIVVGNICLFFLGVVKLFCLILLARAQLETEIPHPQILNENVNRVILFARDGVLNISQTISLSQEEFSTML